MKDNEMLKYIIKILEKEKIEILNIANEKENECLLSFLYKGKHCYITNDGRLFLDNMDTEDERYITKIIILAKRSASIDETLPMKNIDEEKLEIRFINNIAYRLLMLIKNQCVLYRQKGIFGIEYILAEQKKLGNGYQYKNIAYYHNIITVEQHFASRTGLLIKPYNIFTNEELKTILFYINTFKDSEKSKNLNLQTEKIKKTIIEILKGEDSG